MTNKQIHKTAIISPKTTIGKNVIIGPYCIIEDEVIIGDNTKIDSHTIVRSYSKIGKDCHIFANCVIGEIPQDKKFEGEKSELIIGDNTVVREFWTLNRGTKDDGAPKIGSEEITDSNLIWTFLGYPVLNVPIFYDEKTNLPYGLQIICKKYYDLSLLDFAETLQKKYK